MIATCLRAAAAACLALAAPAAAATLYDNGPIDASNTTWNMTDHTVADATLRAFTVIDDFELAAAATIRAITFSFFSENATQSTLFAIYASGGATQIVSPGAAPVVTTVANGLNSGNALAPFGYTRALSGLCISLSPGTYLLGLSNAGAGAKGSTIASGPGPAGAGAGPVITADGLYQSDTGFAPTWDPSGIRTGDHMAFSLSDMDIELRADVPLPAPASLLLLGLGGLAVLRRAGG